MVCNIRDAAVQNLQNKKLITQDPFNGLMYLTARESEIRKELIKMRNRYAFRYGVHISELPGLPMVVKDRTNVLAKSNYRRDTRIEKQWVVDNGKFFETVQKLEDERENDPDSKAAQIEQAKDAMNVSMLGVIEDLGITIERVKELTGHEDEAQVGEALSNFITGTIQHINGKEEHIPEELMHFWTMILKDTGNPLYASMRSRIFDQPEYAKVKDEYGDAEGYTEERIY